MTMSLVITGIEKKETNEVIQIEQIQTSKH